MRLVQTEEDLFIPSYGNAPCGGSKPRAEGLLNALLNACGETEDDLVQGTFDGIVDFFNGCDDNPANEAPPGNPALTYCNSLNFKVDDESVRDCVQVFNGKVCRVLFG